jgi:thiol-disulfide isomerase/thioredoxin
MRASFLITLIFLPLAFAEPPKQAPKDKQAQPTEESRHEAAINRLFGERGAAADFDKAAAEAAKENISGQAILEARFLYLVDKHDDAAIAALLPDFLKHKDTFKLEDSEIFAVPEDWLAVIEYVQSIDALRKGDRDSFKKHITEAFWLSPHQGSAFAGHIERLRLDDAMRDLRIDLSTRYNALGGGDKSLAEALKDRKALLVHFWIPWSHKCEESLPDFLATAKELEAHGVGVVSMLVDPSAKAISDARETLAASGKNPPGSWIADHKTPSLARQLRIRDLPAMVIIDPGGRVLYNGTPDEDELWAALQNVAPGFKRPAVSPDARKR